MKNRPSPIIIEKIQAEVYLSENGRRYFKEFNAYKNSAKFRLKRIMNNRDDHGEWDCRDNEKSCAGRCHFETDKQYDQFVNRYARKLKAKNQLISEDQKTLVRLLKVKNPF